MNSYISDVKGCDLAIVFVYRHAGKLVSDGTYIGFTPVVTDILMDVVDIQLDN
jgi:hypothetical protein